MRNILSFLHLLFFFFTFLHALYHVWHFYILDEINWILSLIKENNFVRFLKRIIMFAWASYPSRLIFQKFRLFYFLLCKDCSVCKWWFFFMSALETRKLRVCFEWNFVFKFTNILFIYVPSRLEKRKNCIITFFWRSHDSVDCLKLVCPLIRHLNTQIE